jgi:CubicO group peptidase (beta-lactamase class C family)
MKKLLWLLLLILPIFTQAQTIVENADAFLNAYTMQNKFSGAVLIAKNDKIIFNKAYGYADLKDKKPNTIETEFRAGSLTKMFTSALILKFSEGGKISLDDLVTKYIPSATWANNITIKNLLSHTSGIHGSTPANAITLNEMVEGFKPDSTTFHPNQQFEYNNFNYLLLSYIAQKITNISYPELLQKEVINEVGLEHSGIDSFERKSIMKAYGYVINPENDEWVITGNDKRIAAASGAGALFTTTGDLFKWSEYVNKEIRQGNVSFTSSVKPVMADYGLGWICREQNGHKMIGHTGSVEGFISMLMMFPEDSTTIIFLSNLQDLNTNAFVNNLVSLVFNQPYEMPVVRKEIALPDDVLKEYTGTYGEDASTQLKFNVENNKLVVLAPGGDKIALTAEAKDKFFMKGDDIDVRFNRDNKNISSVFVSMGNQTIKYIN